MTVPGADTTSIPGTVALMTMNDNLLYIEVICLKNRASNMPYHFMMLPGTVLLVVFSVIPLIGLVIAFQRYNPVAPFFGLASKFVGLQNFRTIFVMHPDSRQVIINTLIIAFAKIVAFLVIPVAFALLLNECLSRWLKRAIQTVVYLPHFLSWVIAGAMFRQIFSTSDRKSVV